MTYATQTLVKKLNITPYGTQITRRGNTTTHHFNEVTVTVEVGGEDRKITVDDLVDCYLKNAGINHD